MDVLCEFMNYLFMKKEKKEKPKKVTLADYLKMKKEQEEEAKLHPMLRKGVRA
jgi:hypothetical protein